MSTSTAKGRAFTLVEVLVVVAILGVAGLIVAPHLLDPGVMHVQAAARTIISDILMAQNEAMARQGTRTVAFDVPANSYELRDQSGDVLSAAWNGDGRYVMNFTADSRFAGVRLVSATFGDEAELRFDEMGTPTQGGTVEIESRAVRYRISVAPFTGRVTIQQVDRD